jgi:nucleotide-binding universal stress UspA family protein
MGKILCATRGGEASYRTQDAAIALAQEQGDELLFLYVVDIGFLDKTASAVRPDVVATELENLGQFLLLMAEERAEKQNVHAGHILRHGELRKELKAAAQLPDVTLVVLGRPAGEESAFVPSGLTEFASEIESETGTPVRIV